MKKRIISGLTAVGMVLLQVPVLITTTLADNSSMEQAYYQVLDDIVKEYGVCNKEYTGEQDEEFHSGLAYATLLDFDGNGTDELFTITLLGGFLHSSFFENYLQIKVELWSCDTGKPIQLSEGIYYWDGSPRTGPTALSQSSEGWYYFHSFAAGGGTYFEMFWTLQNGVLVEDNFHGGELYNWDNYVGEYNEEYGYPMFHTHNEEEVTSQQYAEMISIYDTNDNFASPFLAGAGLSWTTDLSLYYDLQAKQFQSLEADEILAKLPYTGDISKIKLTAEQALAMAEEIENLQSGRSFIALFDSGTYVPAMIALESTNDKDTFGSRYNQETQEIEFYILVDYSSAIESHLYIWNKEDKKINMLDDSELISGQRTELEVNDGETKIYRGGFSTGGEDTTYTIIISDFNGGNSEIIYTKLAVSCPNMMFDLEWWASLCGIEIHNIDEQHLLNYDPNAPSIWASGVVVNGYSQPLGDDFEELPFPENPDICIQFPFYSGELYITGNWADGKEVATLLRAYAEKAQFRYNFPELSQETATIDPILSQLDLSGEISEFYQLGENIFYLIFPENGVETACIVKLVKIDGELCYTMVEKSSTLLDEDFLLSEATNYSMNSNILLNFEEVYDFSEENQYLDYLILALDNITGASLTDNGKSELVTFLQDSITNFATYVLDSSGGTGEINSSFVGDLLTKSNDLYNSFLGVLADKSEELNKNLQQSIRVIVRDLDPKNWTIFLNEDLLDHLGENNLQIFLEDGQHGLEFSGEDLNLLLSTYGGIFVNVQMSEDGQYFITFADKEGNNIEKLEAPVKIFLPTDNEFATVMLEYAQGTENWGGQFNSATNTIQFSTIHSGTYLIVDNSVEIHDVDEAYKSIIQFMVSKGFFTLDEDGNFNPNGTMSRYDFTKIIVSMFFALDRGLTSNFPDVSEDSPYYSYIASGESRDIVAGYDDGLFYGDTIITEEMVFTLIAQTLVDKKGYSYPPELEAYLKMVSGGQNSTEWAQPGVALSVRDAIVLPNETINPTEDISRQNAAVYLYRLFMLLEEKQQVNFELSEEIKVEAVENAVNVEESSNIMPFVGGATFLVGGSLWYLNKKKKKTD